MKTILSPLLLLYYTKVTDTGSGVKMDAVCVCVRAAFKASVGFVCALWLSVKSSIVPFKTKEPLCVQTQQAVASHSVELCWNDSSSPRIHAVTLTHTHKLSPCLYVCLPFTHKQTEPSSQGTESCTTPLSKSKLWTLTARQEKNGVEKKGSLSLRGVKLFLCSGLGWPCEDSDTLLCKERQRVCALLAGVTLTSNTPDHESRFLSPLSPAGPCAHSL